MECTHDMSVLWLSCCGLYRPKQSRPYRRRRFGFETFCCLVYRLHLHDRTTNTRYFFSEPSLQYTLTFFLLISSCTQRHILFFGLLTLENSSNQGSDSIGRHCPSQIMSRMGLRLVQNPFDTYRRILMPLQPGFKIPKEDKATEN